MSKPETLIAKLTTIRNEEGGDVTFRFADGTSQRQPINRQFFLDERNKPLDMTDVVRKLNDICHDRHALDYEVE